MDKRITMSDIAKKLNISTVTVSNALANRGGVSDKLRQDIFTVAAELGYSQQRQTPVFVSDDASTLKIGILIAEYFFQNSNSFYFNLYQALLKELHKQNLFGMIELLSSESEEKLVIPNMLRDNQVSGLIILGQLTDPYLVFLNTLGLPTINLDFYSAIANSDCVLADNTYGGYIATNHLIENGHRNIAFLGNIKKTSSIMDRYLGYYKSLIEHDIPLNEDWIIDDRDESGFTIPFNLPDNLPSAFFCNCDETAYQLIKQLKPRGIRIPQDVSVVSFDDSIYATLSDPQLTSVAIDLITMAQVSVEDIVRKIRENPRRWFQSRRILNVNLVIRDSVRPLKG